jgi:hypothetical protein
MTCKGANVFVSPQARVDPDSLFQELKELPANDRQRVNLPMPRNG